MKTQMHNKRRQNLYGKRGQKFLSRLGLTLCFVLVSCSLPYIVKAQEALFYVSPAQGTFEIEEKFSVDALISVEGIAINAAQTTIHFPPEKLRVIGVSKQNSIFTLWAQEPIFSNSQGTVSFIGGLPSPGYIGKSGRVIRILFEPVSLGEAKVIFGGEKILANDPYGTDIFSFSQEGNYLIIPPEKIPPKPPEIDTKPPYPFEIIIDNEGDPTNPSPLLYFETKDDLSGMSHYEVKIDEGDFLKVKVGETTPFKMPIQLPGIHQVVIKAVDKAGNFIEEKVEVKIEPLLAPQITICPDTFMSGEEVFYLGGNALPNSTVIVSLERDGELIQKWEVASNKEGDWSLAKEGLFTSGIYKISAKTRNSVGAESNPSEPCFLKIILGGFPIGSLIISYKTFSLIIIILLILLLLFVLYLFWRIRRTRKSIKREVLDLKKKFYKEYNELQADIERELEMLRSTVVIRKRELMLEEKKREEELLKNLADIKTVLEKELKDIEEIR